MTHVRKKIFFISPYPHGTAPSQRFRYEQYLSLLKEEGYIIELYPFIDEKGWQVLYQKGQVLKKTGTMLSGIWRRWKLLFKLKKADSIFIHREMAQFGPPVFEWIATKILRVKYIYDFDDAIWLPNYSESNAKIHWIKCYWKVPYCIRWADKVTAGNAYLADYAKKYNSNVIVLPTTIDTENHHNRITDFQNEKINIGWTGTHSTMNYLEDLVPVLKRLEQEFTFTFTVISNKQPDFQLDSLVYKDWKKETEIADLATFSIGVMPLREDKWSKGKCGFKALQYMSLGIPCVISPIGVNTDIISNGENGFLAATPDETYTALKKLMQDQQLRQTIGIKGRETIVQRYSTLANYQIYQQLFS